MGQRPLNIGTGVTRAWGEQPSGRRSQCLLGSQQAKPGNLLHSLNDLCWPLINLLTAWRSSLVFQFREAKAIRMNWERTRGLRVNSLLPKAGGSPWIIQAEAGSPPCTHSSGLEIRGPLASDTALATPSRQVVVFTVLERA